MTPRAIRRIAFVLLAGLAPASAHALPETVTLRSASVPSGGITTATLTLDARAVRDKSYSVSVQGSNAAKVMCMRSRARRSWGSNSSSAGRFARLWR